MIRNASWILGCVVLCVWIACGGGGNSPTSSGDDDDDIIRGPVTPVIKGAVRDTSGQGLAGAVVEARALGGTSVIHADTTNAQGDYRLVLQGYTLGRDVEVQARLPGFRDTTRTVKLESSETIGIIFDLEPVIKTAIVGTVTDPLGRAVAQAVVETDPITTSVTTGADGTFRIEIELTESTTYTVRVRQGNVSSESQVVVNPSQESSVGFVIQPLGQIQFWGVVRDVLAGGTGLANTSVSLRDSAGAQLQTALSGADGLYGMQVEAVVGQSFILQAEHVGFASDLDTVTVQGDSVVVDFSLSLVVAGTVQDPRGQAVPNAVITSVGGSGAGAVDNDGQFVLVLNQNVAGDTLIVKADGFQELRQWVVYSRSADNQADFQLQPLVDPQPQVNPQTLVFDVLAERDTLLINGASDASDLAWTVIEIPDWLVAEPVTDTVRAFESGRQLVVRVLRNQLPSGSDADVLGSMRLAFNSSSIPTFDVPVSVTRQSLTGRVFSNGIPLANATVSLRTSVQATDVLVSGITNGDGRYALGVVPAGGYALMVEAGDNMTSVLSVTLRAGEIGVEDVSLTPLPQPAEMVYESGVPFKILADPSDADRAYVLVRTNPPDNTIKVVSGLSSGRGQTSRAGSDITVGQTPTDGDFYNQNLVVACYEDASVWMVDLNTQAKIRIMTSPGPFGLDVEGNRAYVACEGENRQSVLDIVDLEAHSVIETVAIGEIVAMMGDAPWGPDVAVFGTRVFVTDNKEASKALIVDLVSNPPAVTGSINTGGYSQEMVVDEQAVRVYVLDKRNPAGVTIIDGFTYSRAGSIEIEKDEEFPGAITLLTHATFGRRLLLVAFYQDVMFYDLDLEMVVGQITTTDNTNARIVSMSLSLDGTGLLVGLERAELGNRLVFLQF